MILGVRLGDCWVCKGFGGFKTKIFIIILVLMVFDEEWVK